jgi:hemerythrin-like domain-containing protein
LPAKARSAAADAKSLTRLFETFDLMYENHVAREDTIVFPAWKSALSERQLHETGDKFEDIEREQFGKDGYEDGVAQIAQSSKRSGSDLAQFTPPSPSKA